MRRKKLKRRKKSNKFVKRINYSLNSIVESEIKKHSLRIDFSKESLKNFKFKSIENSKLHEDLTDIPFITIDGEDSKDFDDAVWAVKNKNEIDIMIAIADVSFYVQENDKIDQEAKKRGNSFYFPNKVLPMIPEFLSNDLCSLSPNNKRACLVVKAKINLNGNLISSRFSRAVIKSKARLNYTEVEEYLTNKLKNNLNDEIIFLLKNLNFAFNALKKNSVKRGKIELDHDSFKIKKEKTNENFTFLKEKSLSSNKLIEELMVFANKIVADFIREKKILTLYRNHEEPSEEKKEKLNIFLKKSKIINKSKEFNNQKEFNEILNQIKNVKTENIVENILRSQSKAYYHYKNKGHFGLALQNYTHFTSPIRRYSDLIVHRSIINKLFNGKINKEKISESLCEHLLDQEKKAESIERSIFDRACCLYLKKSKKKYFSGFIDGITDFGMFIKAIELPFSGLARFNVLSDDYYIYDEIKSCIIGKKSGNLFQIGQKISFKIKNIDINKGRISLNNIKKIIN